MASGEVVHGGVFLTLEGIDGCGKTTQVARLCDELAGRGLDVVSLREPGGTPISEKVRALLLDPDNDEMSDECELLLYEAARAQLVRQVVEPALAAGSVVVCDRFFDSTFAYQAGGRGIDEDVVLRANALGSCGVDPDVTILLDLDPDEAFARATAGGADRMEAAGLAFQRRVREGYRRVAELAPDRVRVVDATGTPDQVTSRILEALEGELAALLGHDATCLNEGCADERRAGEKCDGGEGRG